jgi:hypothetical protein
MAPMKTLTLMAAGLLVTASGMPASTLHLVGGPPLDHTANVSEQARAHPTSAKKETLQVLPRTMLGLPRNG